tara:strand:- start:5832 stop:6215 length:384 start_codon:yes stop_codon:yes gene_type:complete
VGKAAMEVLSDQATHLESDDLELEVLNENIIDANSDMDILDEPLTVKEIEMCEEDMLKQICYQILDRIEFEYVPNAERDALCRIILNRGLMNLKEGRVTYPSILFHLIFLISRHYLLPTLFFLQSPK